MLHHVFGDNSNFICQIFTIVLDVASSRKGLKLAFYYLKKSSQANMLLFGNMTLILLKNVELRTDHYKNKEWKRYQLFKTTPLSYMDLWSP